MPGARVALRGPPFEKVPNPRKAGSLMRDQAASATEEPLQPGLGVVRREHPQQQDKREQDREAGPKVVGGESLGGA